MAFALSTYRTILVAITTCGSVAEAQPVPLTNPSFESPGVAPGTFAQATPPGWTVIVPEGTTGVVFPLPATWGYAASHGNQLIYLNGSFVQQQVGPVAAATYTLAVDVHNRPGFYSPEFRIRLIAGTIILADDLGGVTPPPGGFVTRTLVAVVPAGSPAIGQPLRITLGGPVQTNFDHVRLTVGTCYANCDGSSTHPVLNIADFTCFLQRYAAGESYANCDQSTVEPLLNVQDFTCFLQGYAAGCP